MGTCLSSKNKIHPERNESLIDAADEWVSLHLKEAHDPDGVTCNSDILYLVSSRLRDQGYLVSSIAEKVGVYRIKIKSKKMEPE
jgi:hypothetical protein